MACSFQFGGTVSCPALITGTQSSQIVPIIYPILMPVLPIYSQRVAADPFDIFNSGAGGFFFRHAKHLRVGRRTHISVPATFSTRAGIS